MRLTELVETSRRVSRTSRRLEKIELLADLLRRAGIEAGPSGASELEIVVAFLAGSLRQGRIGIGPSLMRQVVGEEGAESPALTIREVDDRFTEIGATSGRGSAAGRRELLGDLIARATLDEAHFLSRLILGELRQGALAGLLIEAIAKAADVTSHRIRRAVMLAGDPAPVAHAALTDGAAGLGRFRLHLFRPLQPMLAQPSDDVETALGQLEEAAFEYKLDGARIQVHKAGEDVRVFSRTLKEVTAAVPEVVETVGRLPADELILDGEVLALRADGRPHPFQTTMRRFGRRLDVEEMRRQLPLSPFWFDLLHLDGRDLIDDTSNERAAALADLTPTATRVPRTVTGSPDEARAFLDQALAQGHEGVMAKATDAPYAAGSRGRSWLKIKPVHTLDLVVLAAEWGHGRRHGWLSNLHLGARDTERGGFVMLGKTFKGLTDRLLTWQTTALLELEIGRDDYTVFVEPKLVVEIAFNDLQASPRYPGGLALRFARVKRYRDDKPAAEADTFETVRRIYRQATGTEPPSRP